MLIRIFEYRERCYVLIAPELFFKLISDETRLRILLLLHSEGELCVCELVDALEDSQPKISRHLAQLRAHGVLTDSRRGQWVFYRLASHLPAWVNDVLNATANAHSALIKPLQEKLTAMKNRPTCC